MSLDLVTLKKKKKKDVGYKRIPFWKPLQLGLQSASPTMTWPVPLASAFSPPCFAPSILDTRHS